MIIFSLNSRGVGGNFFSWKGKELKIAFPLRGRTDEVVKSPNKPRSHMVNSLPFLGRVT
jgi:hypothetical protein